MDDGFVILDVDLREKGLVDAGFIARARAVAERAFPTTLSTDHETSREAPDSEVTLACLDGRQIATLIPEVIRLYEGQLRDLAESVTGRPVRLDPQPLSRVNLNVITEVSGRYPWHVDTNSLTGLLFATTRGIDEGGHLEYRIGDETQRLLSRENRFLLFDARAVPHHVTPLTTPGPRISLPMNYYFADEPIERPADLDAYLYGSKATKAAGA